MSRREDLAFAKFASCLLVGAFIWPWAWVWFAHLTDGTAWNLLVHIEGFVIELFLIVFGCAAFSVALDEHKARKATT